MDGGVEALAGGVDLGDADLHERAVEVLGERGEVARSRIHTHASTRTVRSAAFWAARAESWSWLTGMAPEAPVPGAGANGGGLRGRGRRRRWTCRR
nr:hypothetical protein GCM10025732_37660 [Glycomyces mayteni]